MKTFRKYLCMMMMVTLLPACTTLRGNAGKVDHPVAVQRITYQFSFYPSGNARLPLYQGKLEARPYETAMYESETSNFYDKAVETDVANRRQISKTTKGEVKSGLTLKIHPYHLSDSQISSHINLEIIHLWGYSIYRNSDSTIELPKISTLKTEQKLLMMPGKPLFIPIVGFGARSSSEEYVLEITARLKE